MASLVSDTLIDLKSGDNKSYDYLLNVEPTDLVFLKTYNTEFDEISITFTDQNGRPL